jgi:hypothetical protein
MLAYQIVDFNNPVSVEYMKISQQSFIPAIQEGYISEIIPVQAITPANLDKYEHLYEWHPSLMIGDGSYNNNKDHSPSEKAGMCTHWELMKKQGQSDERFLVLEHDAYLIPEHQEYFYYLLDYINENKVCYANIGLFMACYTFDTHCAQWMYQLLHEQKFWINGGPYSVVERLFRNYTDHLLRKRDFNGIAHTVIHPWGGCDTIGMGRRVEIFFNERDENKENSIPTPVTQVISKRLQVTQEHHTYRKKFIEEPWTRHPYFHVID